MMTQSREKGIRAEHDAEQKRQIEAEDRLRRQREEERQIREASARNPDDFAMDRRLNELARVEVTSLERWVTDVLGLADVRIERRRIHQLAPPASVSIGICWTYDGERRSARFGFTNFPTVREAFRQSLGDLWGGEDT